MSIPEFVKEAQQKGIKPIAGCEFRNDDDFHSLMSSKQSMKLLT